MGTHTDTRTMKRLPDSPPRIAYGLRFWILALVGIDLALIGLAAVLILVPVHPNYPVQNAPVQSPQAPSIGSVYLPMGSLPPENATSATVEPSHPAPTHRATPTAHKPSTKPTAVPSTTPPSVVQSPSPSLSPPTDPDPSGSS